MKVTLITKREEFVTLLQVGAKIDPIVKVEITDMKEPITPEDVASVVIPVMMNIPELADLPVSELGGVPLGKLRRDAYRTLGVCRYVPGLSTQSKWTVEGLIRVETGPGDVRRIDLHPQLLTQKWFRLAASVLYHEYLHALGLSHGHRFRYLESLWPDEDARFGTRKRWPTGSLAGSFSLEF